MWDRVAQCIRRSAEEILGVSRGGGGRKRGTWWWNEEVREIVKEKQKVYADLSSSTSEEDKRVTGGYVQGFKKVSKEGCRYSKE